MSATVVDQADRLQADARAAPVRWVHKLFHPVDISFLVFFRITFAGMMLWHIWRLASTGSISFYYVEPVFHFTYYGFGWVRPWPGAGMYWHFAVMALMALGILVGFCYRFCAVVFCAGFVYEFLLEKALYQNHYYLLCLISFWMIFLPAHRVASVDAVLRPKLRSSTAPAWTLWLLRAQLGITYFYGGLAKLNSDWLQGQPVRWALAERTHYPLVGPYFAQEWMVQSFAIGGLLFDLLIVPALLWRRTRTVAYILALGFHLINAMMWKIGIFPWFMILATLLFYPPDWPRRVLTGRRLRTQAGPQADQPLTTGQKFTAGFLGLYMLVQLLVPFRHYLYPGDVSWTEEGHRFAWHMLLRGKTSAVRIYATDPRTGRTGFVRVEPYLTRRQIEKLGKEPDMLVEFAHFLAGELARRGHPDVEIRALVIVSLNGRKPQLLIDPRVDLAAEPRTWRRYPWVVPLEEPLRTEAWDEPVVRWEKTIGFDSAAFVEEISRLPR